MERNDIITVNPDGSIAGANIHPECNTIDFKLGSRTIAVNKKQLLDMYDVISLKSNAKKVYKWTEATGVACPNRPRRMDRDEVQFIINMVTSELVELAQTVTDCPDDAITMVQQGAHVDVSLDYVQSESVLKIVSEQADAAVDVMYYLYNAFAKKGVNLDSVFDVVHAANEAKRHPDGTFHRRADGKVLKPDDWKEPNIDAEIERQTAAGSWSH